MSGVYYQNWKPEVINPNSLMLKNDFRVAATRLHPRQHVSKDSPRSMLEYTNYVQSFNARKQQHLGYSNARHMHLRRKQSFPRDRVLPKIPECEISNGNKLTSKPKPKPRKSLSVDNLRSFNGVYDVEGSHQSSTTVQSRSHLQELKLKSASASDLDEVIPSDNKRKSYALLKNVSESWLEDVRTKNRRKSVTFNSYKPKLEQKHDNIDPDLEEAFQKPVAFLQNKPERILTTKEKLQSAIDKLTSMDKRRRDPLANLASIKKFKKLTLQKRNLTIIQEDDDNDIDIDIGSSAAEVVLPALQTDSNGFQNVSYQKHALSLPPISDHMTRQTKSMRGLNQRAKEYKRTKRKTRDLDIDI